MAKKQEGCKGGKFCMLISLIMCVIGLYALITGIKMQVASSMIFDWMVLLYYLVAAVLISSAKMHMCKAHGNCNCK